MRIGVMTQLLFFLFQDQITGLLQDLFSFNAVHYTIEEELAADVLNLTKERFQAITQRFAL